ncbi:lysozyme inhibitor LprI family protein [Pseudomonas sp. NPDC088414]|uniref:lysozyme inhibitor LprI family protein n=1 Tax=Pseudomonas sp. NPDC088414 TaxID=3364454 RepID=UPI00381964AB
MTRVREISSVIGALVGAGLCLAADSACAASFDCAKARTADEKAVCANRTLNDLDVTMGELFSLDKRLLPMGGRDALIGEQQAFLKSRKACGAKGGCLTELYQKRVAALRSIIETRVMTQGPF